MENSKSPNKAVIAIVVVALLAIAATVVIVTTNNKQATDAASTSTSDTPTTSPTNESDVQSESDGAVKDGAYSATGTYSTPGGTESIGVKVTLTDSMITEASVTTMGETGEAQEYQSKFASGFKSQVVGKKIDEVSLSRVAGSSLTSNGFNDALSDIEKQAQA